MEYKYKKNICCKSAEETFSLGETLAKVLPNGTVCILCGDLGAGKTCLVKGVASGLSIKEKVLSPTFNIMKLYLEGTKPLVHIDAYRLEDANKDIGLDEFIGIETGLTFIEWPQYIEEFINRDSCLEVAIINNDGDREITISSNYLNVGEII